MPKAKLSQIAATWIDEDEKLIKKKGSKKNVESNKTECIIPMENQIKKKQTFNLKVDTIKRLWMQRIRTNKPLSEIMDSLVATHLPAVDFDKKK